MDIYDFADEKRISLRQVMDFTTSVNPLGPSSKAKHLLRKNINNAHFAPDRELRYLTRGVARVISLPADNIKFGHNPAQLISAIFRTIEAKTVLVLSPVSRAYEEMASCCNVELKALPLSKANGFSPRLEEVIEVMPKVDTVLLPYPHNIMGTAFSMKDLLILINEADRLGKILILDESYRDFTTLDSPVRQVVQSNKLVIVRDFSLIYGMAGLPLAYCMASVDTIRNMRRQIMPGEISPLAEHAALASLKDTFYIKRTGEFIQREKDFLLSALATITGVECTDTPCPFIVLAFEKKPNALKTFFSNYRILVDEFSNHEEGYYLKVPVRKHMWNARFIKTLRNFLGRQE